MTDPSVSEVVPIDEQPTLVGPAYAALLESPVPAPTVAAEPGTEPIVCPECGTSATVTLNRRESRDFCRVCDYPLFWTPAVVLRDTSGALHDSLRRLPGTVGRSTVASLSCPRCAELNAISATLCVRCGALLHPVEPPPPEPEPVYVPPPPEPEPVEPERGIPWWVWLIVGVVVAAVIALVVLLVTHTIG